VDTTFFYIRHNNLLKISQVTESSFIEKLIKNMSTRHITIAKRCQFAQYSFCKGISFAGYSPIQISKIPQHDEIMGLFEYLQFWF